MLQQRLFISTCSICGVVAIVNDVNTKKKRTRRCGQGGIDIREQQNFNARNLEISSRSSHLKSESFLCLTATQTWHRVKMNADRHQKYPLHTFLNPVFSSGPSSESSIGAIGDARFFYFLDVIFLFLSLLHRWTKNDILMRSITERKLYSK